MNKVLIIDDEDKLRNLLGRIVALEGFEVFQASDCKSGLKALEKYVPEVVLCDVKLPDGNGVELTRQIKQLYPETEVILLTAYGNIPDGVLAIKNGAFDYITKGNDNQRIIPLLYRAIEKVQLSHRVQQLERRLDEHFAFDNIIGQSTAYRDALALAQKVAGTDTAVLLLGETGVGKEVFAQAIHQAGSRKAKPYIAVNCAAFSKELLESELFGHKAGAFTGALKDKKGLFEEANGGTIFLDEIGEMPAELQAKLLRVLENGEYLKVGETKIAKTNVRIIAATNRKLESEIAAGHFRADLFYRIAVFQIPIPPLRERPDDIAALANHFVGVASQKNGRPALNISAPYLAALRRYAWPGNVRELKNVIERSVILSDGQTLLPDTLPHPFNQNPANDDAAVLELAELEKRHILKVLERSGGNKTEAARLLGVAITTLYRKLETYGL